MTAFVCPACHSGLASLTASYRCGTCDKTYPIVCGIPDFRLNPDPYIGIEADRAKGQMLWEFGQAGSFEKLLRHYYAITPEDPPDLAKHWIARSLAEPQIAEFLCREYRIAGDRFLDVGCSTGSLLAAASGRCASVIGVDVAFRWLVLGALRLQESGVDAQLICANAEHLPFAPESFDCVAAIDTLEHVRDAMRTAEEVHRVSVPRARAIFRTNNRYAPLPEPHVRLWGVGWLPRKWQARYVATFREDLKPYAVQLRSVRELQGLCLAAGYKAVKVESAPLYAPQFRSRAAQAVIRLYNKAAKQPVTGALLKWAAPMLSAVAER